MPEEEPSQEQTSKPSIFETKFGLEPLTDVAARVDRVEALLSEMLKDCASAQNPSIYAQQEVKISIGDLNSVLNQYRTPQTVEKLRAEQTEMSNQNMDT